MYRYCICFSLLAILSCSRPLPPTASATEKNPNTPIHWSENGKESDSYYRLKLINTTSKTLIVYQPLQKQISQLSKNGSWQSVAFPYCPCGSPCPNPPQSFEIEPQGTYDIAWNKTYISCDKQKPIYQKVSSGQYRFTIRYRLENTHEILEHHHSFSLSQ